MKRSILALVAVLLVVCCLTLAACDKTNGQEILDSYIFEKADSIVTEDFVLPGKIGGQDASWSSDNGAIALSQRDGDWVAQINYPAEGEVSVKLTVTVAKVSKSFTVRVKALDVYDFMSKYSFPKDKATIVDNFALDQEFSYKGKTATISWTVDENYELYIKVSEDGKTLEVTPQSVQTSVQVKARFTYNGETAVKSYRMTVYKEMEGLELVNYWYTNTGVSIDMSGYVVAIATAYSEDYGNVSLYMVNDDLTAGYYLFRVKASAANAAKLAPGVHITATGTTNTNYNGLIETNAGGNLVVDDKEPIDINNTVYAIDEEILGNLPATVYNESRLVSLTNWKVTKVAEAKDKAVGSNFTLLTLTKGKVDVDVRVSKYMEGAYATKAEDANWTALCNLTETATVGKTVNVTGILSKYKDTWQIMPLSAAAVTLSDKEADAEDKADYTGMKVATAINAVNAFVTEQKLDGRIQETKEFAFPTTNGDVEIAYEVVGSSNAIVIKDGTMSVTPGNPETTTVLVTYTLGEFKTVQFLHITSLVPSAASMLEDIEVPKNVANATNLPDAPAGATVEWEVVNNNDSLAIKNGQFIPTLKEDSVPVIVRATLTYDGETRTKDFVVVVSAGKGAVAVEMPLVEDKGYLLAVEQKNLSKTLYAVGEMSGDYLKTTDNHDEAVNFFVEVVEAGGYRLYFKANEAKNYISITVKANSKGVDTAYVCFEQDQTKAYVWNWNAENNCFTTPVTIGEKTEDYYIGTYNDFATLSASKLSYVSSSFPAFAAEIAFVPLTAYDIKVADTSSANAHVELQETKGINGEAFTFTVNVDEGYEIVSVTVNDEKVEGVDGVYTGYVNGETTVRVSTKVEGAALPTNKVDGAEIKSYDELGELIPNANDVTTEMYYTMGTIKSISSTKYGNSVIEDSNGNTFTVYGMYDFAGEVRYDSLEVKPIVGDFVVLYGTLKNFNGTKQIVNARLAQLNDTVYAPTYAQRVEEAKVALALENTTFGAGTLSLPATGINGTTITWASDNGAITIAEDGITATVVAGTQDVTVNLTATITLGGVTDTKVIPVTVTATTPEYTVTYTAESAEGTRVEVKAGETNVESGTTVLQGTTLTITVVIDEDNYVLVAVKANGTALEATEGVYTYQVAGDVEITVEVKKLYNSNVDGAELKTYAELEALVPNSGNTTTEMYYTIGTIKAVSQATYGNCTIEDANGNTLIVYGMYDFKGETRYDALSVKPVAGDFVVLYGVMTNYNGTKEMKNARLAQLNDTVYAPTYAQRAEEAKEALTLEAEYGKNFELPATGLNGTTIEWISGNTGLVSIAADAVDGKYVATVIVPASDENVTLTAKVTLGTAQVTRDFTITVKAASKVTLTYSTSENGTFEVKAGDSVVESGAELDAYTTITVTVTPADGYRLASVTVGEGEADTSVAGETSFELTITENTTFTVAFEEIPAEPVVLATATFGTATNSAEIGSYTDKWSATCDGVKFDVANFNNNKNGWAYIKCGRKGVASVASISTNAAMTNVISKIVVTIDAVTTSAVNSIKLVVASDADFANVVETIDGTVAKGDMTFNISADKQAANLYYKVVFDCNASATKNGPVQVSKVQYYGFA